MNQRDNKSDDELLVGGAKKRRRRRRREKEGSGLGQGGSQFPSTLRRHEKWTESGGEFSRLIISLFCRVVASRRREKWRDRGMRFFVPPSLPRRQSNNSFRPSTRKIACQIGDNRLPRNTNPPSGWTQRFLNFILLILYPSALHRFFLYHYEGREDWWTSSGITFQREKEEMQNSAGVIWIFYGDDREDGIESGVVWEGNSIINWHVERAFLLLLELPER